MSPRVLAAVVALGAVFGCTEARTQIVLQLRTDMTQGPAGELGSVAVRVYSEGVEEAHFDRTYALGSAGGAILLPTTLGLVPDARPAGELRVEVDAIAPDGDRLFTRRAIAAYRPEETLLLDVVLAARCLAADARVCDTGFGCGLTGCEADRRPPLPAYAGTDAGLVDRGDGGPVVCTALCDGECVDTERDPLHCGACDTVCEAPTGGSAACNAGVCGSACGEGAHLCGAACASDFEVTSCGARCEPCASPPSHGSASCDGTACGFLCDPGYEMAAGGCSPGPNVAAPVPVAPLGFARLTSLRPTFRWRLGAGSDGVLLELCRDPACADVVLRQEGAGESLRVHGDLAASASGSRRLFYRLYGRAGGATGSTATPVRSFTLPARERGRDGALGVTLDLNGDGLADLAVGSEGDQVRILLGQPDGDPRLVPGGLIQTSGSGFGAAVAAPGDMDGDGYGELAVGAPAIRRVYLYRGGPEGIAAGAPTILVGDAGSGFGSVLAAAGDVDGDGFADLAVGGPDSGRVYLYRGGETLDGTVDSTWTGSEGSALGSALAPLGDLDGDGFGELAAGDPTAGEVWVVRGAAALPVTVTAPATRLEGIAVSGFGGSLAGGLDLDGDGRGDLAVGAPTAAAGAEAVFVYAGAGDGVLLRPAPAATLVSPGGATYARRLSAVGDADQDGFDDLLVGAPGDGTVWLHRGGPSGMETDPAMEYAPVGQTRFGDALAGPGDLDGDGSADLCIGAPGSRSLTVYRNRGGALDRMGSLVTQSATAGFGAALARRIQHRLHQGIGRET